MRNGSATSLTKCEVNFANMATNPFGNSEGGLSAYGGYPRPGSYGTVKPVTVVAYAQMDMTTEADKPVLLYPCIVHDSTTWKPTLTKVLGDGVDASLFGVETFSHTTAEGTSIPGVQADDFLEFNSVAIKVNCNSPLDDIGGIMYGGVTNAKCATGAATMSDATVSTWVSAAFNNFPKRLSEGLTVKSSAKPQDDYPLPQYSVQATTDSSHYHDGGSDVSGWRRPYVIIPNPVAGLRVHVEMVMHIQYYPSPSLNMIARHGSYPLVHSGALANAIARSPDVVTGHSFKSIVIKSAKKAKGAAKGYRQVRRKTRFVDNFLPPKAQAALQTLDQLAIATGKIPTSKKQAKKAARKRAQEEWVRLGR